MKICVSEQGFVYVCSLTYNFKLMLSECNEIFLGKTTFQSLSLPSPLIHDSGGTDSFWNAGNLIQYSHIWLPKKASVRCLMLLQLGFTIPISAWFHTSVTCNCNYWVILIWDFKFFSYEINKPMWTIKTCYSCDSTNK